MATPDAFDGDPLIYDNGEGGDLYIVGGQPMMSSGLENAVYLSLFVERNWWGNDVDPANPGSIGSAFFLPLTERAALTPALLNDAQKAAEDDLAWMLSDGVAKSVTVACSIVATGWMGLDITIEEPDDAVTEIKWKLNWMAMKLEAA